MAGIGGSIAFRLAKQQLSMMEDMVHDGSDRRQNSMEVSACYFQTEFHSKIEHFTGSFSLLEPSAFGLLTFLAVDSQIALISFS